MNNSKDLNETDVQYTTFDNDDKILRCNFDFGWPDKSSKIWILKNLEATTGWQEIHYGVKWEMSGKGHLETSLMKKISRRQFLKHSVSLVGTLAAVPHVVSSLAISKNGSLPPSERITLGLIGSGKRGLYDLTHFLIE